MRAWVLATATALDPSMFCEKEATAMEKATSFEDALSLCWSPVAPLSTLGTYCYESGEAVTSMQKGALSDLSVTRAVQVDVDLVQLWTSGDGARVGDVRAAVGLLKLAKLLHLFFFVSPQLSLLPLSPCTVTIDIGTIGGVHVEVSFHFKKAKHAKEAFPSLLQFGKKHWSLELHRHFDVLRGTCDLFLVALSKQKTTGQRWYAGKYLSGAEIPIFAAAVTKTIVTMCSASEEELCDGTLWISHAKLQRRITHIETTMKLSVGEKIRSDTDRSAMEVVTQLVGSFFD